MPELHGHGFTDDQENAIRAYTKHYVADALRPLRIRFYMVLLGVVAGIILGLFTYNTALTKAEEVRNQASCDSARRVALLVTVAIPHGPVPGRTLAQQRNVDKFYKQLEKLKILNASHCSNGGS